MYSPLTWHPMLPDHAAVVLQAMNVLGTPLRCCCNSPVTGYYRDGFCRTGGGDYGVHVVCAQVRINRPALLSKVQHSLKVHHQLAEAAALLQKYLDCILCEPEPFRRMSA